MVSGHVTIFSNNIEDKNSLTDSLTTITLLEDKVTALETNVVDDTLDPLVEAQIAETVQRLIPTELTKIVERISDMEEITLSMLLIQMSPKFLLLIGFDYKFIGFTKNCESSQIPLARINSV